MLVARFDKFASWPLAQFDHGGQLLCTRGSDRVASESEEIQLAGLRESSFSGSEVGSTWRIVVGRSTSVGRC